MTVSVTPLTLGPHRTHTAKVELGRKGPPCRGPAFIETLRIVVALHIPHKTLHAVCGGAYRRTNRVGRTE